MTVEIAIPVCSCVAAARQLSKVFPIPSKYSSEGGGTGANCAFIPGYLVVSCGYCGTALKSLEGINMAELALLREEKT